MRRTLLLAVAAAMLSGCGSGDATVGGGSPSSDGTGLLCQEPPEPPSAPLSFAPADLPDPVPTDPASIVATITTTCGDIELQLEAALAPQTVASFAFLAEQGYWDDSPCHRLTTSGIFVLQCGDPTGTGRGNPGYAYGIENAPADGSYPPGTLAMARTMDPNSNGGQFFIVYANTQLPTDGGGYSVFGTVTDGLEIVEALAAQGARGGSDGAPAQPISILSVDVED